MTDCGEVNPADFGTTDMRTWLAGRGSWGIGLGEMTAMVEDPLMDAVVAGGGDWATDWEPNVFGAYVSLDGLALEMGYAFSWSQECGMIDPDMRPLPTPTLSVDERVVQAQPYWVFAVTALL